MTAADSLDLRRRRLRFRSWHRGMRENDLMLGSFADAVLADLNESDVGFFEDLLEVPDPELYAWLSGTTLVPAPYDTGVMRRLQAFLAAGPVPR